MFGLLNIDKPQGVTSRHVVNEVQRQVRPDKAGHTGTLDPLATGVLIVAIGQATRLNEYLQQVPKRYTATFALGRRSDTEDLEGEVEELEGVEIPSQERLRGELDQFCGSIMQRPPAFSALKVKGERAYKLARRGHSISLEARPVTIHQLELLRYAYPEVVLDVVCSSGTYLRSLGRDLGESLGSAAVMTALRRTSIGPLTIEQASTLEAIRTDGVETHLASPALAVAHFPQIPVSEADIVELGHGRFIDGGLPEGSEMAAAIDARGNLIALVSPAPGGGLKPHRCFAASR